MMFRLFAVCVLFSAAIVPENVSARVVPSSPCPKFFNYFESKSFEVFGATSFENDLSGHYELEVNMTIPVKTDKNISIKRKTPDYRVQNGEVIEYYILFPFNHTFPTITSLKFQGNLICVGPKEEGADVTHLTAKDTTDLEVVHIPGKKTECDQKKPVFHITINNIIDPNAKKGEKTNEIELA